MKKLAIVSAVILLVVLFLIGGCQQQAEPTPAPTPAPALTPPPTPAPAPAPPVPAAETTVQHNERGIAFAKQGRYEEAISEFSQAIELDPNYTAAYRGRGFAYHEIGERDKAIP